MATKTLFRNNFSSIVIRDEKMYILSNKYRDYSPMSITVLPGFQIELGRSFSEIKAALNETRLPVMFNIVTEDGNKSIVQIVRMHTGKVSDKVVAVINCTNDIIQSISFNRQLLKDSSYRRYNQLSIYHQLSMPCDLLESGCKFRHDQVLQTLRNIINNIEYKDITINEDGNKLNVIIDSPDIKLKMLFISNKKTNRFELISISLI